ncbi:MAG TPA: riboflavin synthase [Gemmataceae bacterium]|nr:riboflavin synthase [Gemmataceae bacterium]
MFTGLVQALGTVRVAEDDGHGGRRFGIAEPEMAPQLSFGESVAVNGACMTVIAAHADWFVFEAGPESLARTTLKELAPGDRVNLERALRAGDLLGGHFVSGHIDCVGTVLERIASGEWETVWFAFPPEFGELMVEKGSVAVDGVSLTLVDVLKDRFSVMLIPHTRTVTTLGLKPPGAAVNLEFDLLAKHVQKLIANMMRTERG